MAQNTTNLFGPDTGDFPGPVTLSTADNAQKLDNLDSTQFVRSDTSDTMSGNLTLTGDLAVNGNHITVAGSNSRVKLGVWNSKTTYGIGMQSAHTFGWLNDYAMTFTMNNDTDRGFWWGHDGMAQSNASMTLTTNGNLCVKNVVAINNTAKYLRNNTGQYGSIECFGTTGGYHGYSIQGRAVFMHNGTTTTGLYNDVNNHWLIRCVHASSVFLYFNNAIKLTTTNAGVSVTGSMTASGDVIGFSDERMKSEIRKVKDSLNKVKQLSGYTFVKEGDNKRTTGVIAQEVEQVLPEAVIDDEETGMKGVAYGNMVGLLIEAIKELSDKVDALEAKIG